MEFSIIGSTIGNNFWSSPDIVSENKNIDVNSGRKTLYERFIGSVLSSNEPYGQTLNKIYDWYYFSEIKDNQANRLKTVRFVFKPEIGQFLTYDYGRVFDDNFRSLLLVEKLSTYKENWDGYGAKPYSSEFTAFLKDLVLNLEIPVLLSPVGSPSVVFSYSKSDKKLLFEVHETNYHYVIKQKIGKKSIILKSEVDKYHDIQEINKIVKDFFNEY